MPFSVQFGIGVVFIIVTLITVLWNRKTASSKRCVPFATFNIISVAKGMTSSEPYLYLHELSQRCKRNNFRLCLPIFRLQEFSVGGHFSFYLPLPILKRVFVVGDVELARRILQDPLSDKPCEIFSSFEGITKAPVLFTSKNSSYTKSIRRTAHRAFSLKRNSQEENRMRSIAQTYIAEWLDGRMRILSSANDNDNDNDTSSSSSFDPVDEALAITFYIICDVAFGYKATYQEFRTFTDNLDLALHEFAYKQSTNPLRKIFWPLIPGVWKAKRASQSVRRFVEHLLIETLLTTTNEESSYDDDDSTTFLTLLLENVELRDKRKLIVSEIIMFMAAGHETTGAMISNLMILLAKHQDVQDKLRTALIESKDDTIGETPYFKCVMLEANRIFPVAVMGSTRLTGQAFVLNDGSIIPADSICFIPQYLCYRDPANFKDPNVFDPDRWKNSSKSMKDAASFAFSLGPRSCPGKPLATEEINQLLPQLLLRYSLHLDSESQPDYRVILKHSNARLKAKALAAASSDLPPITEKDKKVISSISCQTITTRPAKGMLGSNSALFYSIISVFVGIFAFQCIHTYYPIQNCPSLQEQAFGSLKIAILTEPSPIGSYICGQSKRILFLMEHLVENTNDDVTLITAEVHDKVRPAAWQQSVPVHYTYGMPLPSYNQISLSFDWSLKALRELLKFKPDLIHVTTPGPLLFPSVIASRILGNTTLVMSCHTHLTAYAKTYLPPGLNVIAEWMLWRYTSLVHSFAHLTLVTSPQIQEEFQRHGIPRVEVWQKGVNSKQFHPDFYSVDMRYQMSGGRPDNILLVYIGRLASEKRLVVLKGVLQRIPGATLCFIGAGPYENPLKQYFEGTETIFLGELKGLALSQAFASGDVFCMPSTSETLGFVVLESMASGVPVVAADAGGLQHLIENGRTGFLVTPDNETGFVDKIQELKASPLLRKNIVKAARQEVELWTWESSMMKLRNDLYPRAIKNLQKGASNVDCGENLSR